MSSHLDREIRDLKSKLLSLSLLVEENLSVAVKAIKNRDLELSKKVRATDFEIDKKEVEVEEECLKLLALYQPVAIDLRFVIAALKINSDLERIGDLSVSISKRVRFLTKLPAADFPYDYEELAKAAKSMVKKSIQSLVDMDSDLARQICVDDDKVDMLNKKSIELVYEKINQKPENTQAYIHFLSISKNLERIADYATNIAEDVIYLVDGDIVRHEGAEL